MWFGHAWWLVLLMVAGAGFCWSFGVFAFNALRGLGRGA